MLSLKTGQSAEAVSLVPSLMKSYENKKKSIWFDSFLYDLLSLENSSCFHMTDTFSNDFIWLLLILKQEESSCFLYDFSSHIGTFQRLTKLKYR